MARKPPFGKARPAAVSVRADPRETAFFKEVAAAKGLPLAVLIRCLLTAEGKALGLTPPEEVIAT